jgi:hypothetical protein
MYSFYDYTAGSQGKINNLLQQMIKALRWQSIFKETGPYATSRNLKRFKQVSFNPGILLMGSVFICIFNLLAFNYLLCHSE